MDIFISYRRSDSQYLTWQIHRALCDVFGDDNVFLDLRDIDKGDDFRDVQFDAVRRAKVVLVVIGDRWSNVTDRAGRRRLADPEDSVRREIETALASRVLVVPVFLESVTGVSKNDLPDSIQALEGRNGHRVRPAKDWVADVDGLIDVLKEHVVASTRAPRQGSNIKNDLKVVLEDHGVSSRLLISDPPRLLDCVRASRTCYVPVHQKGQPLVAGFAYNHFIGVGAVLGLTWPRASSSTWLSYPRASRLGEPANILRRGSSILFHASYELNVTRTSSRMDAWLGAACLDPQSARQEFVRFPGGVLFDVLGYKVQLPALEATVEPFAVLTRDMRKSEHRVYTQYVFRVQMQLADDPDEKTLRELLRSIRMQHDNPVSALPSDITEDAFLLDSEDSKVMDYLALRGLRGDEPAFEHETGRFARGFGLT